MIAVRQLSKTFDPADGAVLDGLSFEVAARETLAIIGPSGCGKTTLLYILAGLSDPSDGSVFIGGGRASGQTAFILQDFGLFPWKTASQNIVLGLQLQGADSGRRRRAAAALLDELGLTGLGGRYPVQLSGGQKQRVAIARALATRPDLILMDEPFSSLDALTREHLQNTMVDMWRRKALSYIIVTHSVEEAVFLGRRVAVLTDRPTRIKALIDNPSFGRTDLRCKDCYFDRIREVRREMEA
ncbi:MAG: ABC transporter ATP-binding protein [Desulfosarcina sp.]|nr:ABC transporter ATP-binding protein [Desulfobacterales bacterium]